MKRGICLAVGLLLCLNLTAALSRDDYPRSSDVDAIHYRIRLDLAEAGDGIRAETEILLAITRDGVRNVSLDFGGLTVDQVTEEGKAVKYERAGERLSIELQSNRARGERCTITIKYHGRPVDGLFIKPNKFGDRTIFADNWPNRAHHWFPAIDHPYDKATIEFFVTAPDRYDVIANGELIERTSRQNRTRLTHWSESTPIPVYCMIVGVAEFSVMKAGSWSGIPVWFYIYPKDRDRGIKDYGRAVQMIEFYSKLIGPYPYEKLALVQSSTRFGGMENSSSIFFDEKAFDGSGRLEDTVAHEIAHQWFGDSVTEADWHHLWLSESFATYFGHLFFERADGRDRFLELMRADRESYLKDYAADPRPIYDPQVKDLFALLNRNNYEKGGWVLHMLRRVMGEGSFFEGIRDYYRTYRDRNALTEDFQGVMELRAGRSLDWFFKQWIYEPGYPVLEAKWRWDETRKQVVLRIEQKQPRPVYRMPLDVEFKVGAAKRREMVELSGRDQTFAFKLTAHPTVVVVDPDEWVLKVLTVSEEK